MGAFLMDDYDWPSSNELKRRADICRKLAESGACSQPTQLQLLQVAEEYELLAIRSPFPLCVKQKPLQ
jgi:hypothetical protein